jgi:CRISPR-associated protein Cmr2
MSKTYLALTIGPIYKTIQRARKTRELWVASFLLSQFMKELLGEVQKFGTALSPDLEELTENKKYHGAGIWNDNCFFEIHDEKLAALKTGLPKIIKDAKSKIIGYALHELKSEKKKLPLDEDQLSQLLEQHFHCHAVLYSTDKSDEKVLVELGKRTASAEMRDLFPNRNDDFISEALFRGRAIRNLYDQGFDFTVDDQKIFTPVHHYDLKRRLPSLLEIAVREFRDKPVYKEIEKVITEKIKENDEVETDEENQEIIKKLKELPKIDGRSLFKKRHKYVAIVQSDGDGVGSFIQSQTDAGEILKISKALMAFSTAAVEQIVDYDALPVYAGGDDLLFIAPLRNKDDKSIFDLIENIKSEFDKQTIFKQNGASLSFGISIFYYKYPLGEALENGRELLNKLAKKLVFDVANVEGGSNPTDITNTKKKKALAFRVMLHAGQSFAAVLRQEGTTWNEWTALLKIHSQVQSDTAFVSGVVHTLEKLEWLLAEACNDGTTEYFFEHHFNEAKKGTARWDFVQQVRKLAEAIFSEYGELKIESDAQDKFFKLQLPEDKLKQDAAGLRISYCNNLLYSALRIIQFLNADDHE